MNNIRINTPPPELAYRIHSGRPPELSELDLKADIGGYLNHWKQWLKNHYQNLLSLINIFNGSDRYIDLCALLKFLKDFICIPDLARMLSVLMNN